MLRLKSERGSLSGPFDCLGRQRESIIFSRRSDGRGRSALPLIKTSVAGRLAGLASNLLPSFSSFRSAYSFPFPSSLSSPLTQSVQERVDKIAGGETRYLL